MQDLNLNVETTVSGASVQVFAAPANYCTTFGSLSLIQWITPAGVGNIDLPFRPGYIVPNGYQVYVLSGAVGGWSFINGYLIPSSGAPTVPG